ncbi:MAG: RNA polymerase sigma factor [Synergistaceae bacterium]|jgi:RNA polymerase sigma-70 factor (ECF subfamily)|nr:RNA polymerase sigma factor [Synergistaceae bacterium]
MFYVGIRDDGSDRRMLEDVLMMKIAEGDEDSFVQLYEMWCRRIMSYALRSLRDLHEAQDVVQETFIQVYRSAPSYRAEGKFGAYVLRIAGNLVRHRFRSPHGFRDSQSVESLTEILEEDGRLVPESLTHSPEESVIEGIDIERLLAALPVRQREALILVASGVSYAEAAEMMSITADAFAQLVLRGRRTLKIKIKRMSDEP